METRELDVVYCLKNQPNGEELRYSLRSLKNLPHRNVWIYGGCPVWAQNIRHVPMLQPYTKWRNTAKMLFEISQNTEISKNFIWFNDDFFVLQPCEKLEYWYENDLGWRKKRTTRASGMYSLYGQQIALAEKTLRENGKDTRNFELHLPIIFNRYKLGNVCRKYPDVAIRRSMYCNEYGIKGVPKKDVKIAGVSGKIPPRSAFVSSSDGSFASGEVGKAIKKRFPERSTYEKPPLKPQKPAPRPSGISATPYFKFPK